MDREDVAWFCVVVGTLLLIAAVGMWLAG